jgi:anthraniloyl-CoA monooxygenase
VKDVATPKQYDYGKQALFRNAARAREEAMELRRKGRPTSHAPVAPARAAE